MRDPTGRSRCFGFVSFADPIVVDIVLQKTHILDKKQIDPKRAIPKDQQPTNTLIQTTTITSGNNSSSSAAAATTTATPAFGMGTTMPLRPITTIVKDDHKVFVGGIHIEADEHDLKETFSNYDEVLETILMRDRESGRSRGFGFVTFSTLEGAQRACSDTEIRIRGRKVEVKMAVPKGKAPPAAKADGTSSGGDPYAAWTEYFKQYPEYYEAMMKAYSNPATMAAYYSQYYGGASSTAYSNTNTFGSTEQIIQSSLLPQTGEGGATYDPAQFSALMGAIMTSMTSSQPPPIEGVSPTTTTAVIEATPSVTSSGERGDSYRPTDYDRRKSRPLRSSHEGGENHSHSPSRSASPPRSKSHSPNRGRERTFRDRDRRRDRRERRHHIGMEQQQTSTIDNLDDPYHYVPARDSPSLYDNHHPHNGGHLHSVTIPPPPPSSSSAPPPPPSFAGDSYRPSDYGSTRLTNQGSTNNSSSNRSSRSYHPYSRPSSDRRRD